MAAWLDWQQTHVHALRALQTPSAHIIGLSPTARSPAPAVAGAAGVTGGARRGAPGARRHPRETAGNA